MFEQTRPYPCPSCKEIISGRMPRCKYCHAPIDEAIARMLAETQGRVNQACSDASYLKAAAAGMWVLLGVCFIPLLPLVEWCFLVTFVAVPVLVVRWQLKFNDLNTSDPDYARARRAKNIAFVLWLAAMPVGLLVMPLVKEAISPNPIYG